MSESKLVFPCKQLSNLPSRRDVYKIFSAPRQVIFVDFRCPSPSWFSLANSYPIYRVVEMYTKFLEPRAKSFSFTLDVRVQVGFPLQTAIQFTKSSRCIQNF